LHDRLALTRPEIEWNNLRPERVRLKVTDRTFIEDDSFVVRLHDGVKQVLQGYLAAGVGLKEAEFSHVPKTDSVLLPLDH